MQAEASCVGIATPVLLGNDPDQLKDLQGVFCNHSAHPQPDIESRIYRTSADCESLCGFANG